MGLGGFVCFKRVVLRIPVGPFFCVSGAFGIPKGWNRGHQWVLFWMFRTFSGSQKDGFEGSRELQWVPFSVFGAS